MTPYHLFLSSGSVKPNGYQGTFVSVEAAEKSLPVLNESIVVELQGRLYETQPDGSLKAVRVYVRFKSRAWRAMRLDEGATSKTYRITPDDPLPV